MSSNSSSTKLISIEVTSAVVASGLVAPFICIIDKAIFSNASGKERLIDSIKNSLHTVVKKPGNFFRQPAFLWIWGAYGGTYIVANVIQGLYEARNKDCQIAKFFGGAAANISLSVTKDSYFTKTFGSGIARPIPLPCYALYTVRDGMTIFASFNLPPILAREMTHRWDWNTNIAETTAQLIAPCAIQLLSSPLHLLGMDIYNRSNVSTKSRLQFIRKEYVTTTAARMARIFPAFGIGGVANKFLRTTLKKKFLFNDREYERVAN